MEKFIPLLLLFFVSANAARIFGQYQVHESDKCTAQTTCSTHTLTCNDRDDVTQRIVLRHAWNGFLHRGHMCQYFNHCLHEHWCCFNDPTIVCKEELADTDLAIVAAECCGEVSCSVAAMMRNVGGGGCTVSANQPPISSFIQYSCIPEDSIVTTAKPSFQTHVRSTSVLLQRNMFSLTSHAGSCLITAPSVVASLRLYSYAVVRSSTHNDWSVIVRDVTGQGYVFNASYPAFGKASSLAHLLDTMLTPISVNVYVESGGYPDIVWIGFESAYDPFAIHCEPLCADCVSTHAPTTTTTKRHPRTTTSRHYVSSTTPPPRVRSTPTRHDATTSGYPMTSQLPNITSGSPMTSQLPNTTSELDANLTAAMMKETPDDDGDNNTGLVVGLVIPMVMVGIIVAVVVVVVVYRRRRLQRRKDLRTPSSLPSFPRVDDGGYCVPVTACSPVSSIAWNLEYYNGNTDINSTGIQVYFNNPAFTSETTTATRLDSFQREAGHTSSKSKGIAGEDDDDSIYENVSHHGDDNESGIDAESFDSDFHEGESFERSSVREHVYRNTQSSVNRGGGTEGNPQSSVNRGGGTEGNPQSSVNRGGGTEGNPPASHEGPSLHHHDDEEIYYELVPEYSLASEATTQVVRSNEHTLCSAHASEQDRSQHLEQSGHFQEYSPADDVKPTPGNSVANRVKRELKGVGKKVKGLLPRRRKQDFSVSAPGISMSPVQQRVAGTVDLALAADSFMAVISSAASPQEAVPASDTSPAATRNSPSYLPEAVSRQDDNGGGSRKNTQRRLPYIPQSQTHNATSRLDARDVTDEDYNETNQAADDSTGIYHVARSEDMNMKEVLNPAFINDPVAPVSRPCTDLHKNKLNIGEGRPSRNDYENQMPRGLIAEAKQVLKTASSNAVTHKPTSREKCPQKPDVEFVKDKESYTVVQGKTHNSEVSAALTTTEKGDNPDDNEYSVPPSRDDNPYSHVNTSCTVNDHVPSSDYDHVTVNYDVPPSHTSEPVYFNIDNDTDQEEC